LFGGGYGDMIFSHRMYYYIAHEMSKNIEKYGDMSDRKRMFDVIFDEFDLELNDAELYAHGVPTLDRLNKFFESDGDFIQFIVDQSNTRRQHHSPELSGRITLNLPKIDIYKNIQLWKYVLSLPEDIYKDCMLKAGIQDIIISRWANNSRQLYYDKSSGFSYDYFPERDIMLSIDIEYKHTPQTQEILQKSMDLIKELGCSEGLINYYQGVIDESGDLLYSVLYRLIIFYMWYDCWLNNAK